MRDRDRDVFEAWWKERNPCNSLERMKESPDTYITAFARYGWQAWQVARDHYASKLTEKEAVEKGAVVCADAKQNWWDGHNGEREYDEDEYIAREILSAIGVNFKEAA